MNVGAFGEGFPYSNFHDLNMDWIIQIAKNFLDQYTHIQQTIDTGLENLNTTAAHLTDLLNQWYETHSEDIANELANAIAEFDYEMTSALAIFDNKTTIRTANAVASIPADYTALSDAVLIEEDFIQRYSSATVIQGGYNNDGSVNTAGTNYLRSRGLIPIYPGMAVHFKGGNVIDRMMIGYFTPENHTHDATHDIAWSVAEQTIVFDLSGFIVPLFRRASNTTVVPAQFDAVFEVISKTGMIFRERIPKSDRIAGNLEPGTPLYVGCQTQPRKGLHVGLEGRVFSGTFPIISIGVYNATNTITNRVIIDDDYITLTKYVQSEESIQHGLTLANNIQITIDTELNTDVTVSITSDGNTFTHTFHGWQQWATGYIRADVTGGSLFDCKLSWEQADAGKLIWYFGDSYTGYGTARWPYYADKWIDNILLDGIGGESSSTAVYSFMQMLEKGIGCPEYAVLATGINDPVDESNTTPNPVWLQMVTRFIEQCRLHNITPILCTVPTVPDKNHNGKTFWVRQSKERFIDFALAVGSNGTGAWYPGMLSSDNIHPTQQGARALCKEIEIELPEVYVK